LKKKANPMVIVLTVAWLLTGCASMSKKFSPQQKADLGIFADHTITMLSEADFGFSRDEAIYIREFLDGSVEGSMAVEKGYQETGWFFGEIVDYSVGLVTIVEANKTDAAQVAAYKSFMSGFSEEMLSKLELEPDYYASVLEDIGQQEAFLGALQKGQVIVNAAARYMHRVLDQLEKDIDTLVINLEDEIDARYSEVILYQEALEEEKYTILRSFGLLYLAYKGEPDAFQKLMAEKSIRREELLPKGNPTVDELEAIGRHLGKRLDALHLIEQEIERDWDTYRDTHKELDSLHGEAVEQNSKARLITLVWLRAHQKMASGVSTPAEWFDLKSLPGQLFKLGTRAVF
jgi:hypothetical protein